MRITIPLGSVLLQRGTDHVRRMRRSDDKEKGTESGSETSREERREPSIHKDSSGVAGVQT